MDFQAVWTATLAVGIVGLVVGILLSILGKVLAVESDERIDAVREVLPGNNCGGCGLAGCDACAKAIVEGTVPVTVCPVGGAECTEKIAEIMGVETDPFYGAPCVIVVLADPALGTWIDDGSLVMGNLLNAAHGVGVGSCYIFRAKETFETPEGKALLKAWGVPEHYVGVGNCILGYAAESPAARPRKENYIIRA